MKDISDNDLSKLFKSIDLALDAGAEPIAAFDADGTLWDMDMGEHFFHYQIEKKLLKDLPPNPWDFYWEWHERDTKAAFLWLAQINKGVPIETVRQWSQDCTNNTKVPVFSGVRKLIDHLHKRNVQVYVVTASIKWAVEPGAALLGIPRDNVIGIKTKVKDGIVTDEQEGPITWREGKVLGLFEATGKKPFLCAGNTMGDLALLENATHLRVVNAAVAEDHSNYSTERELIAVAKKHGWFHHVYRD